LLTFNASKRINYTQVKQQLEELNILKEESSPSESDSEEDIEKSTKIRNFVRKYKITQYRGLLLEHSDICHQKWWCIM